jgi:hypothetical protein
MLVGVGGTGVSVGVLVGVGGTGVSVGMLVGVGSTGVAVVLGALTSGRTADREDSWGYSQVPEGQCAPRPDV